uniref:Uncharacterized protein n=1 Tax=Oryza meridionalis TaxID=40149 RepID=A0A0E0DTX3_9ORYZ
MPVAAAAAAARAYGVATPPGGHVSFACAAMATTRTGARRAAAAVVVLSHASGGGGGRGPRDGGEREEPTDASSSWLVDEDMATLRRRIREAREAEAEEEGYGGGGLPAEWTELERRHHGSYVAGVRGAVVLLQAVLVSARPGLGAGLLALLLLGVPASVLLVSAQLLAVASAVLSGT